MHNKFIINNTGQCYKVVTQGQRKRKEADIQMQLSLTENRINYMQTNKEAEKIKDTREVLTRLV